MAGYDYSSLKRENNGETLTAIAATNGPFISTSGTNAAFTQPNTDKNTFTFGVEQKWSPCFDTFLRYKFIATDYPLYGVTADVGQLAAALNSALPTQENRVELGCTWTPTDCLMVNATLYVENAENNAPYVNWESNSLPFTLSAWWSATQCWSFSIGAAEMDSWINQNTTLSNLWGHARGDGGGALAVHRRGRRAQLWLPLSGHGKTVVPGRLRVGAWRGFQFGHRQPE